MHDTTDLVVFGFSLQAVYGGLQAGLLCLSPGDGSVQGTLEAGLLSLSLASGLSCTHFCLHALFARPVMSTQAES